MATNLDPNKYYFTRDPLGNISYYDSEGKTFSTNPLGGDPYRLSPEEDPAYKSGRLIRLNQANLPFKPSTPTGVTGAGLDAYNDSLRGISTSTTKTLQDLVADEEERRSEIAQRVSSQFAPAFEEEKERRATEKGGGEATVGRFRGPGLSTAAQGIIDNILARSDKRLVALERAKADAIANLDDQAITRITALREKELDFQFKLDEAMFGRAATVLGLNISVAKEGREARGFETELGVKQEELKKLQERERDELRQLKQKYPSLTANTVEDAINQIKNTPEYQRQTEKERAEVDKTLAETLKLKAEAARGGLTSSEFTARQASQAIGNVFSKLRYNEDGTVGNVEDVIQARREFASNYINYINEFDRLLGPLLKPEDRRQYGIGAASAGTRQQAIDDVVRESTGFLSQQGGATPESLKTILNYANQVKGLTFDDLKDFFAQYGIYTEVQLNQ